MASFQKLPGDLLLQLSRLLNGADLISFSFSYQACYRLSRDSTAFWKHDIVPGLLVASGDGQANLYREAVLRRWRFRKLISERGDTFPHKARLIVCNYLGKQISEVIVPGTHYLLAVAICNDIKKLVCFDLQAGTRMEVEGDIEPGSFKIDATRGAKEAFNILVVSNKDPTIGFPSPCYFDVYEGVLMNKPLSEGRSLQLRRVARKECFESILGLIEKITLEGYYIIMETGSHPLGLRGPSSFHIMNWSPSSTDREAIVWRNNTSQPNGFICNWHAVGDLLLVSHTQIGGGSKCQLYVLSFKTLQEACGLGLSLAPPSTPYPSVQGWDYATVYHMAIDRTHIVERSNGSVDLSTIVTGYANDRPETTSVNVCGLSSRVILEEIARVGDDNRREILPGPSKRYGAKVELSIPPNSVDFTLPKHVNTAKLNDGVFWGICDHKLIFQQWDRRKRFSADLYVCDTRVPDPHSPNVKAIKELPAGNAHLADMDVGVVCTVQITCEEDQKFETKILIDWYS